MQRHRLTADLADQGHRSVGNFAVCVLGQRERGFVGLIFIGIREPMSGRRMLPFERLLVLVAHAAVLRRRAIGGGGGILASRVGVSDLGHFHFDLDDVRRVVRACQDQVHAVVPAVLIFDPVVFRLIVVSRRGDGDGHVFGVFHDPVGIPEEVELGVGILAEIGFPRHPFDLGRRDGLRFVTAETGQGQGRRRDLPARVLCQSERGVVGLVLVEVGILVSERGMLPFERFLVLIRHAVVLRRRAVGGGGVVLTGRLGTADLGHIHFQFDDVRRIVRAGKDQGHAVVPAVLVRDPVVFRLIVVSRRGDGDGHVLGVLHDVFGIPEEVILGFGVLADVGVPRHPLDFGCRNGLGCAAADTGQGQARRRDFPVLVLGQSECALVGLFRVEIGIQMLPVRGPLAVFRLGLVVGLAVVHDRRAVDHVGVRVAGRLELLARHLRFKLERVVGVMRAGEDRGRAEIVAVAALDPIKLRRIEVSEGGQDLRRFVEELAVLVVRRSVIGRKAVVFAIGLGINRFGDGRGNGQRIFAEETFKGYFGGRMILAPRPDGVVEIVERLDVVQHSDLGRRRDLSADQQREIEVAGLVELETEFGELLDPVAGEDHVAALVGGGDGEAFPVGKPYALDDDEDLVPLVPSR